MDRTRSDHAAIQLPKDDSTELGYLFNHSRGFNGGGYLGYTTKNVFHTKNFTNAFHGVDPVLYTDHRGLRTDRGSNRLGCLVCIIGFYAEEDEVHLPNIGGILRGYNRVNLEIPKDTFHMQAIAL